MIFFDLETDGLLAEVSRIWTAVAYNESTKEYLIYHVPYFTPINYPSNHCVYTDIQEWLIAISNEELVGHNIIQFDLKVLRKLHNFCYKLTNITDTHILSRLFNPDREGHSLAYWGGILGFNKGEYNDWTKFSQEMLDYCIRDVDVTRRVYYRLMEEGQGWDWSESIKLENYVWDIMSNQEQYGVLFDAPKAEELLQKIEQEIQEIEETVLNEVPKKTVQIGAPVMKPFKKDGTYTKVVNEFINKEMI